MKVKYTVSKSKKDDNYIVWRNTETENGFGCKGVFKNTSKKKCYEMKKKLEKSR